MSNNSYYNDQWRIINEPNQNKVSNYSMKFDGTSAEIDLGTSPSALIGAMNPYSVTAWVYVAQSDLGSGTNYFIMGAQDGIDRWYFRIKDGYARFAYGTLLDNTNLTPITGDQWNHVVFTYDGVDDFTTYINGVNKFTVNNSTIQGVPNFNIFIGALGVNTATGISHFKGKIDQVNIFDYALPETGTNSVATLYGGGTAVTNPMSLSPKPIAYYQLGDQSVDNGANYLVPNNSLQDYVFFFPLNAARISVPSRTNSSTATISLWVNYDSLGTGSAGNVIIGSTAIPATYWPYIENSSGKFNFYINTTSSPGQGVVTTVDVVLNKWFHIALSDDGTNTKAYINGVPQGTMTSVANVVFDTIGAYSNGSFSTDGRMSNVAYWQNTNLSDAQILSIYNNGVPNDISSLNPTSWWKLNAQDTFDGTNWTIKDYGSSGTDGTSVIMTSANLVQSNLQHTSGYSPYALDLDGINDAIDGNRTIQSNLDFSVSAWVNPISYGVAILGTRGLASASTSNGFTMNINSSGNLLGRIFTETSNNFQVQTGSIIPLNNWSHVAMTYDSSSKTLKTYLNGNEAGSVVGVDPSVTSASNFIIGRASVGTSYGYFGGEVSNVSIFAAELSSTEIIEIYNSGVPSNLNNLSGTKPTSWWQLGSNSSYLADPNPNPPNVIGRWTCLDEVGTNNAASSNNMTEDAITNGVGYSANGLGTSSIDIVGDAPYSTANGLSENQDVLARVKDTPPT